MSFLTGIILLVIGLIACFFGRRLYRLVLALSGFVAGYYLVSGLLVEQGDTVQIIGAIIGGLIVGFLFWSFYQFAYVLFGAFLGLVIAALVVAAFNLEGAAALILALVFLIIGALLGRALADTMIRLGTAFSGAAQAVGGIAAIAAAASISIPLADPTHGGANTESAAGIITLVVVIALGVVGFLYQSRHDAEGV